MESRILRQETIQKEYYIKNEDGTYTKEVRDEDATLRFEKNETFIGLTIGGKPLASTNPSDSSYLLSIFAKIDANEFPVGSKVAHLGGGMGWLAKMLLAYGFSQEIYEIDVDICSFLNDGILNEKVNIIQGDWKQTLGEGLYDIIIYDINNALTLNEIRDLKAKLTPNGKFYSLTD